MEQFQSLLGDISRMVGSIGLGDHIRKTIAKIRDWSFTSQRISEDRGVDNPIQSTGGGQTLDAMYGSSRWSKQESNRGGSSMQSRKIIWHAASKAN